MKTKNIFKTVALAMMMPAMLLTTACSSDDNTAIDNEQTIKKGFELPVTVNVTRQGDDAASSPTNRASYNGTSKKLEFSTGDQLFVWGHDNSGVGAAGYFAGTLTWQSGGTFSGTISIQNSYTGTIDDLFAAAQTSDYLTANLLPAGYGTYGYLYIMNLGSNEYEKVLNTSGTYTFATSKATGVEQFSLEVANSYSAGFALQPQNAILNFTITGLAASTNVDVALSGGYNITKTITTDGSGNATFAAGVQNGTDLNGLTLTVGGNAIPLASSSKVLAAGKIYNVTRNAVPAPAATSLSELKTAINGGTDCSSYIGWEVNSAGAIAESGISGTKIGYVAYVSTSDVDADVSGSRILVIASADASATALTWGSNGTARGLEAVENANDLKGYSNTNTLQGYGAEAHPAACAAWNYSATIPSGGATPAHWFMPTMKQWKNMRDAKGGTYSAMATAYGIDGNYWTSNEYFNGTDYSECKNYAWRFVTNSGFSSYVKAYDIKVRSIFAY